MPWPNDRFRRPPNVDLGPEVVTIGAVNSDVVVNADVGATKGTTVDGSVKSIEMHEVEGMGQLTADLTTHSLLEEVLIELRTIRRYMEQSTKEKLQ